MALPPSYQVYIIPFNRCGIIYLNKYSLLDASIVAYISTINSNNLPFYTDLMFPVMSNPKYFQFKEYLFCKGTER